MSWVLGVVACWDVVDELMDGKGGSNQPLYTSPGHSNSKAMLELSSSSQYCYPAKCRYALRSAAKITPGSWVRLRLEVRLRFSLLISHPTYMYGSPQLVSTRTRLRQS